MSRPGFIGVFGRGPLSKTGVGSDTGHLSIEYERFARYTTPSRLKVRVTPAAIRKGRARFVLSGDFVRTLKAGETAPKPVTTTPVGGDAVQLTFEPSASEPVNTVLAQESQQIGKTGGRRDPRRRKRRGEPVHLAARLHGYY